MDPGLEAVEREAPMTLSAGRVDVVTNVTSDGGPSVAGSSSTIKRKREMELCAARKRFEVQSRVLREQQELELQLIDATLAADVAALDEEGGERRSIVTGHSAINSEARVRDWLDSTRTNVPQSGRSAGARGLSPGRDHTAVGDSMRELTRELTRTIKEARVEPMSEMVSQGIVRRMAIGKNLPTFDGDVLEWPSFKRAFEESTARIGYSEQENMMRLNESLKGMAKEAVASLMVTTNDTSQIMQLLQLRFGNPSMVASRIVMKLKALPKMEGISSDLVTFATTVKNCVAALVAVNHIGYLHSPELIRGITLKMSSAMVYNYNRYLNERNDPAQPALVTLSDFLFFEAEIACKAGVLEDVASLSQPKRGREPSPNRDHRFKRARDQHHGVLTSNLRSRERVYTATTGHEREGPHVGRPDKKGNCGYCKSISHSVVGCDQFARIATAARWKWARDNRVCFRCLIGTEHRQDRCQAEGSCNARGCNANHHPLLHRMPDIMANQRTARPEDRAGRSRGQQDADI